jgi:hypothetical protein
MGTLVAQEETHLMRELWCPKCKGLREHKVYIKEVFESPLGSAVRYRHTCHGHGKSNNIQQTCYFTREDATLIGDWNSLVKSLKWS